MTCRPLFGHFAVFNRWTEINSWFEGALHGALRARAFTKTIAERRDKIRALFQHGKDPQIGDKPLGPIRELREEEEGPYYEVPLLDTAYNRELIPGLEAGLYGASFRFEVMRVDEDLAPERSRHNPEALPERTVKEARLFEFGPVTFPAYADATAGVRSLTDEFLFEQIARDPERPASYLLWQSTCPPQGTTHPPTPTPGLPPRNKRAAQAATTWNEEVPAWQL